MVGGHGKLGKGWVGWGWGLLAREMGEQQGVKLPAVAMGCGGWSLPASHPRGQGSGGCWHKGHPDFTSLLLFLQPCYLRDWEMQVHFKIHGQGKKNLNGDGFAIWYTKDRMQPGPVFGSKDNFLGLGVFVDTYPNEEKQQERVFPYISAMVNNGSLTYDHDRDGRPTELGGCTAMVRNLNHDTFLVIRYVKRRLTVLIDIDGKHEWRDCIDVPGVRLPRGYYFGTSSVTGDLSGTEVPSFVFQVPGAPGNGAAMWADVNQVLQRAKPLCLPQRNNFSPGAGPDITSPCLLAGFKPDLSYFSTKEH
uniref:Lectin, mannose binding 2 like n=1 Tax=Athene cunicularia TaxID=194338 RepID=A0A663NBU1_ATHCN